MFIPSVENMMRKLLGVESPEYYSGYEAGYNQARQEMMEFIKAMRALHNTSTTATEESHNG